MYHMMYLKSVSFAFCHCRFCHERGIRRCGAGAHAAQDLYLGGVGGSAVQCSAQPALHRGYSPHAVELLSRHVLSPHEPTQVPLGRQPCWRFLRQSVLRALRRRQGFSRAPLLGLQSMLVSYGPPLPPWTGNCVAWSNKKFFLLFLLYTALSCLLINCMETPLAWDPKSRRYEALLKCAWTLSLGVGLLLAGYFCFHLWLLREGKTTLEFLAGRRGEFADCSFRHNVTVYFGQYTWSWWLPTTPMLDSAIRDTRNEDEDETLQLVVE